MEQDSVSIAVNQNMIATMSAARIKAQHPSIYRKLEYLINEFDRLGMLEDERLGELIEVFIIGVNNSILTVPTTVNATQGNKNDRPKISGNRRTQ